MIWTYFLNLILVVFFLVCQTTFLGEVFLGTSPDLAFFIVFYFAYENEINHAIIFGFIAGIMYDLVSAYPLGTYTFIFLIIARLANWLKNKVMIKTSGALTFVFIFLFLLLKDIVLSLLILIFTDTKVDYLSYSFQALKEVFFTSFIAILIFYTFQIFKIKR